MPEYSAPAEPPVESVRRCFESPPHPHPLPQLGERGLRMVQISLRSPWRSWALCRPPLPPNQRPSPPSPRRRYPRPSRRARS